ncbi:monovalent cation/H+ antiporter subunit D [Primorskyibacter flagellatus]|uniref:monovalent cation/H+ antiporter subunit D n=1 Tax=Primorskyibacter flagellatus TaxID=1387277 RepID=UPI003A8DF3BB
MTHWIIAPIVLPAVLAAVIVMSMRHHVLLQRIFSIAGLTALIAIAAGLAVQSSGGTIEVYDLGNWPAPFGIVLVLDRLSAMMVLLTAVLALVVTLYATGTDWDRRGNHFHALMQFQVMGIMGAFLTGDIFNLFVFFEILLIASYGLMIHAGGTRRLRAGLQYVVFNLLGSTLFLFALGTIYATTGTLNMADLAVRVAEIPESDIALIRIGAVLLLTVFAIKAALLPLHFWLPETYAEAPAPVTALFAVMTKVGAYSILRVYTLIFGPDLQATADVVTPLLMGAALITIIIGMIGVLGANRLGRLAAFSVIASMGTVFVAMSSFTPETTSATLYYILHSTLATALLFLTVDMVRERRQGSSDGYATLPAFHQQGLIAALFFAAAIAMVGMPPLSGFVGKLLILKSVWPLPGAAAIWAVILITSLVAIVGFGQGGSAVFWKTRPADEEPSDENAPVETPPAPKQGLAFTAAFSLLAGIILLSVFAGPVMGYLNATSAQLYERQGYISAVLTGPNRIGGDKGDKGHGADAYGDTDGHGVTDTPAAEKEH